MPIWFWKGFILAGSNCCILLANLENSRKLDPAKILCRTVVACNKNVCMGICFGIFKQTIFDLTLVPLLAHKVFTHVFFNILGVRHIQFMASWS